MKRQLVECIGEKEPSRAAKKQCSRHTSDSRLFRCFVLDSLRRVVTSSKNQARQIASEGTVASSLLRLLKENLHDNLTQRCGLSIISWITEERCSRDVLVSEGGIEHLIASMKVHSNDDIVQINGIVSLCWLTYSEDGFRTSDVNANNLISIVTATMRRFLGNAMVVGNCICFLIGTLLQQADNRSEAFCGGEITELTLRGMKIHSHSPKVQSNGLTLLRFLMILGTSDEDSRQVASQVVANLTVIESSMVQHPYHVDIQADACGVLAYLASESKEARTMIQQSMCVEAVLQSQVRHRSDVRLQQNALWFFSCFQRDEPTEAQLAFGAGLSVLETMAAELPLTEPSDAT